jgi:hypothetical protein
MDCHHHSSLIAQLEKKCEGGGDDEKRLRIRNFLEAPNRPHKKKDCIAFQMNTWKG